jgi:hypothetical protein
MATASGEDAADGGGGDRCVSVYQRERGTIFLPGEGTLLCPVFGREEERGGLFKK